ncbi:type II secretion system protein GspH [Psychromonas sp. B3M02]|uniref:type II secretion system minor pseudopilin GspH n=1 Tax=Psychromonas sp. B3M02 TaxID=2267226 RepID=UPI000DE9FD95|nr:type II secretion system minor pseudopilin GspH [Psychromonas sp. B3M02]RBW41658.1 type II secretion system protein GspH [Psychromonas sp. B3M02]
MLRHRNRGFTLLEVMLVLLLLGMVSVSVVMTLPSSGSTTESTEWHAQRFTTLVQLAQDQALILNTEFGIQFNEQGYTFTSYDVTTKQWIPIVDERIKGDVTFPDDMLAEFDLSGSVWGELEAVQNSATDDSFISDSERVNIGEEEQSTLQPVIYIMASGEVTPFSYTFFNTGDTSHDVTVKVSMTGVIDVIKEYDGE